MRLGMKLWIYENHICDELRSKKIILKEDHRSKTRNFCSCKKKAWKNSGLYGIRIRFQERAREPLGCSFTLDKPVPRLIRMLVSNWAQKLLLCPVNRRPESIALLYLQCKLDYSPYRVSGSSRKAFFEKIFQWKWGPKKPKKFNNFAAC